MNNYKIYKDLILLDWDGERPPGCSPRVELENVPRFWEHLSDHTRFLKRYGTFCLNLSEQNLARLYKQFGSNIQGQMPAWMQKQRYWLNGQKAKAIKIKALPIDQLPQYSYKMPPIGEYQHRAVIFLRNLPLAPLLADCGVGKSYCVLTSTALQINDGTIRPGKTLVCGKLNTLFSGWRNDCLRFTNLTPEVLWAPQSKNRRELIEKTIRESTADLFIINHEGVLVFEDALTEKGFEKVVVDESTILKGFHGEDKRIKGGSFGKALMNVARNAKWRVIMSGTPAPNGPLDLWGQFHFLDPQGLIIEPWFNDFRSATHKEIILGKDRGPKTPRKWIIKPGAVDRVANMIDPFAYRVRLRDVLKYLPERTNIVRDVGMSPEQSRHYADMEDRLRVVIDDTRITAQGKLTELMKLRQITGGFIIDQKEVPHAIPANPKLETMDSLLEEEIDRKHKVVIFAQYRWEIKTLAERYKEHGVVTVYGDNTAKTNLDSIDRFIKDESVRLIVLHPRSAAHGITLIQAHYMIFYSIDYSAEGNYQAVKRIERNGQIHKMFVYYLLCKGTIDKTMYKVIQNKDENQQSLIDQQLLAMWDQKEET